MSSEQAPVDLLIRTPYIQVITYPKISLRLAKARIRELKSLGVSDLVFEGHARIGRLGILGLGSVGVVVPATVGDSVIALKIRRTDANRPDMSQEVRLAVLANRVGVGPSILGHSKNFILMQLIRYTELEEWLKGLTGPGTRGEVRQMVHGLLNQCRKLDIMGLDHGQLSNLRKHAVVADGKPWILDFESASTSRRPRNVTTAAQYLFVGGRVSPRLRRVLGIRDTGPMLAVLTRYKGDLSDYHYAKLLETLRLARP
jgi:putative serine/threonine protein kinase